MFIDFAVADTNFLTGSTTKICRICGILPDSGRLVDLGGGDIIFRSLPVCQINAVMYDDCGICYLDLSTMALIEIEKAVLAFS